MNRILRALAIVAIVTISTTTTQAEMPEALKGSWIFDADATEAYMQTSPNWKAEDEKYLPTILKRMSQAAYEFTDDAFIVSMRGKTQALNVTLTHSEKKIYIFEGTLADQNITLTASINDGGGLNVRSSATDDMEYYLWKRGLPQSADAVSDEKLALELLKKSTENTPANAVK